MIIHELGTNAVKYGSLSVGSGSLEVAWSLEKRNGDQTGLVIDWSERGGPAVKRAGRRGFGPTWIEREVNHGLGGKAQIEFEEAGLRVNLRVPLRPE